MAFPNVPGISVNFPEADVRAAISFAMQMGAPNDASKAVAFFRRSGTVTYYDQNDVVIPVADVRRDRDGNPLNPNIRAEQTADEEIPVECAIVVERRGRRRGAGR